MSGLPPTVGYLDAREKTISDICELLLSKLGRHHAKDLSEQLRSQNDDQRLLALSKIALHRRIEHFEEVVGLMLRDPSEKVRARAAWSLDNLNDKRASPAFIEAIHDSTWSVRSNAGWGLVHLGHAVGEEVEQVLDESHNADAKEMAELIVQYP